MVRTELDYIARTSDLTRFFSGIVRNNPPLTAGHLTRRRGLRNVLLADEGIRGGPETLQGSGGGPERRRSVMI